MNKNPRILAYILMAVFLVAFVACSAESGDNGLQPSPTKPAPTKPAPTRPAPTQPAPTQPAPTQPAPTAEPTKPVVQPTQPIEVPVSTVTGTVTYLQRIALGPNAIVIVKLLDVSRADASSITLGEQIINNPGQVPVAFEIEYDPSEIDERFTYVVRAEIRENDKLIFTTTSSYPVITSGNPVEVELVLEQQAQAPVFENEVIFDYDFDTDDEGWSTGFADLPVDATHDFYELVGGYRQLPSGLPGGGMYLQGNNHSDDLFMYITKQVSGL